MSIFFDFETGPKGTRFRRAVDGDKQDIEAIINLQYTEPLFGDFNVAKLIEVSTLSICMINDNKDVIGFMALCDHPNIPGVDPSDWEIWMRNMFQKYYLSRNTLFIHFMCCIDAVKDSFIEESFVSIFRNDVYLLNIILVFPLRCPENCMLRYQTFKKRNIYKFKPKINCDSEGLMYLYAAMRSEFCPKLKIRRAVEEDNDDIVRILGKNCPRLQEIYGDYYISEIIGRHLDMDRKIVVADHRDEAVGVMCLNSDINYDNLQNTYELDTLRGLRKATALEKEQYKRSNTLLHTFGEPIMIGKWSPFHEPQYETDKINNNSNEKTSKKKIKSQSKVYFDRKSAVRQSFDHFYYNNSEDYSEREIHSPTPSNTTNLSVANLLDDDPFDYEIVNIDHRLLTVPEVLSCDFLLPNKTSQGPRYSRAYQIQDNFKRRHSVCKPKNIEDDNSQKYAGEPNAFMIELFGLRDDIDDRQSFYLLEGAFDIMKDFDYCIIQVPCKEKSFHLLQHFYFVPAKENVSADHALYVAHRSSVLSKIRVRRAELIDVPQIAQLLGNLDGKETLWTIENTILKKSQLQCYVFMSSVTLIGVGILEQPEQLDFIRAQFNVDSYRIHKHHTSQGLDCGFATLKTVVMYPVFETHYKFFAREMMRLSGSNALMWLTAYRNKWVIHKANTLAISMIPLMPRTSEIDCISVPELRRIRKLSNTVTAFSTWFINKKLTSVPKVNVDSRILVVGASRTAMAFLNQLLFSDTSSYLFFTNVTLVSPHGLPYTRRSKPLSEMMFQKYHTNSDKYLKSIPYTYYVNVIQDTMVEINKREKYILLSNGRRCHYDMLLLLFGKQYKHPDYLKNIKQREKDIRSGKIPQYIRLDIPQPSLEPRLTNITPANVFIVNTIADANKALNFVQTFMWQDKISDKIIVYGATRHAYCCLATLLEMQVPPENIVFIEPFPPQNERKARVSLFCNVYVDKSVREVLKNLKINVYRSYYFHRWNVDADNLVTHVDFLSKIHLLRLQCSAMFYYGSKGVNEEAFIAINKSGMAYDGGILIDHQFRTKDPSIYAAGPATRYCRKHYADTKQQKYFDAFEVGTKLGIQISNQLDPFFTETQKGSVKPRTRSIKSVSFDLSLTSSRDSSVTTEFATPGPSESIHSKTSKQSYDLDEFQKVPTFKKPHVAYYLLPGGLQYLEVRPPGMRVPHHYLQSLQYNGFVMETFKNGYFKLHVTNDLIVDGITCLTPEKFSLENFKNLYGLSATVLNNVHLRYTAKKLDNFYTFFREPWAYFLYHDQSDELFAMVKEILPKGQRHGKTLAETMREIGDNLSKSNKHIYLSILINYGTFSIYTNVNFTYKFQPFNFQAKMKIRSSFEKSPHVEAITDYVLEWLSENDILLPMYLQPWQTTQYHYDLDHNPVFRKRKNTIAKMLSKIF
ncbi:cilia- and flagella-associated protein 61-like [Melitaea cinxia]|uniref:cilia- and flagella-associated protein 61-like n=1 Tax=Melitaea cinxia TaxID=113334 RepID=UPI001E274C6A|nr:cilia- and flagella-associated protein 61-like [Melitaea cinxia]